MSNLVIDRLFRGIIMPYEGSKLSNDE